MPVKSQKIHGTVVKYFPEKGYGFLRSIQHTGDVFVHISDVTNASSLSIGQSIDFEIRNTKKGCCAVLAFAGDKQQSPYFLFGIIIAVCVAILTGYLFIEQHLHFLVSYLLAVNLVTFLTYGYDKSISGTDHLRIPEAILHILALFGGSVMALVSQQLFRHKTRKDSFQRVYWLIVILQAIGFWMLKIYG